MALSWTLASYRPCFSGFRTIFLQTALSELAIPGLVCSPSQPDLSSTCSLTQGRLQPRPRLWTTRTGGPAGIRSPYRFAAAVSASAGAVGAKRGSDRQLPPSCRQSFPSNHKAAFYWPPVAMGRSQETLTPEATRRIRSLRTPMRLCTMAHFRRPHSSAGKHSRQRLRCPSRKRKWLELGPRPSAILAGGGGAAGRNGSACAASRIRSRALAAALPAILLPQP